MVKLILFSPGEFILMPRKGTALQVPYYAPRVGIGRHQLLAKHWRSKGKFTVCSLGDKIAWKKEMIDTLHIK